MYIPYVPTNWGQLSQLITLPREPLSCPDLFLLITHDMEKCWKKFGDPAWRLRWGLGGVTKNYKIRKKSLVWTPWCSFYYQIDHPWCSFPKNFDIWGKKCDFGFISVDMTTEIFEGTATVSVSMHKKGGGIQAKFSGVPSQGNGGTPSLIIPDAHFNSVFHPWCSFSKKNLVPWATNEKTGPVLQIWIWDL